MKRNPDSVRKVAGLLPILDRAPKGRGEGEDDWQTWLRRHDEYGQA